MCAMAAGTSMTVTGSGALADPFVASLALSTDSDNLASFLGGLLFVPGAGPRTAFTAITVTQSVAVAATCTGRYRKKGREIDAYVNAAIAGAGTTANDIVFTLGALPTPATAGAPVGVFGYFRTATQWYAGLIYYIGSSTFKLQPHGGTALATYLGTTPAFAAANGDRADMLFEYESAA